MTTRRDLALAVFNADKAIDKLSTGLMESIGAAVRTHDGPITPEAHIAIMRDVDDALDTVYPARRGAPSNLQTMIEQRAALVARLPIVEQVALMRRVVPDDLRVAMGDEV